MHLDQGDGELQISDARSELYSYASLLFNLLVTVRFDRQRLEAALQQPLLANSISNADQAQHVLNFDVHVFAAVPSTNLTVWELLKQGAPPGTVAIALEQQAGRGQWGRQWSSPPGGLYLSLAVMPDLPVEQGKQLTLCSAWGVAIALRDYGVPVRLKWLNDLVVDGRKLGGILTETRIHQERIHQAVIGVGINWSNPVPEVGINLHQILSQQPSPAITSLEQLAAIVLHGLRLGYEYWQQQGIEALVSSYQILLTNLGQTVTIDGGVGIIIGITATGDLRVRLPASAPGSGFTDIDVKPGTIQLGYR
jgi:BirA family biotin operon repressor/biotin-[acetyl-CoA-carboxylase] ligase